MHSQHQLMFISVVAALVLYHGLLPSSAAVVNDVPFDQNYDITYGNDHVKFLNQERSELEIILDSTTGAGFATKAKYASGFFKMRIKLPPKDSAGVVTTFYLHSGDNDNTHDEVDFEFLGNREGKNITLQTNVFAHGVGGREQRMILPFDPRQDYHTYGILWNQHQIVLFADNIPIRVYKNNTGVGVGYPTKPMRLRASIWDGSSWATDGGQTKVNWSHAPFIALYQGFNVDGCAADKEVPGGCYSMNYWWNQGKFWELSRDQQSAYAEARKYIDYDYCTDTNRYPSPPPECLSNRPL